MGEKTTVMMQNVLERLRGERPVKGSWKVSETQKVGWFSVMWVTSK